MRSRIIGTLTLNVSLFTVALTLKPTSPSKTPPPPLLRIKTVFACVWEAQLHHPVVQLKKLSHIPSFSTSKTLPLQLILSCLLDFLPTQQKCVKFPSSQWRDHHHHHHCGHRCLLNQFVCVGSWGFASAKPKIFYIDIPDHWIWRLNRF